MIVPSVQVELHQRIAYCVLTISGEPQRRGDLAVVIAPADQRSNSLLAQRERLPASPHLPVRLPLRQGRRQQTDHRIKPREGLLFHRESDACLGGIPGAVSRHHAQGVGPHLRLPEHAEGRHV